MSLQTGADERRKTTVGNKYLNTWLPDKYTDYSHAQPFTKSVIISPLLCLSLLLPPHFISALRFPLLNIHVPAHE